MQLFVAIPALAASLHTRSPSMSVHRLRAGFCQTFSRGDGPR